jgi:hypothetical protein
VGGILCGDLGNIEHLTCPILRATENDIMRRGVGQQREVQEEEISADKSTELVGTLLVGLRMVDPGFIAGSVQGIWRESNWQRGRVKMLNRIFPWVWVGEPTDVVEACERNQTYWWVPRHSCTLVRSNPKDPAFIGLHIYPTDIAPRQWDSTIHLRVSGR